ncbi:acyltransferase, partial [Enterobacter hormaechei]
MQKFAAWQEKPQPPGVKPPWSERISDKIGAQHRIAGCSITANYLNKFIMSRILAAITLWLSVILTILVTIACSVPIIVAGIIKLLLPVPPVWRAVSAFCNFMMYCWCEGLAILLHLNPWLKWDVQGLE